MTTPDVPAERERDELLRELSHYWILDGDVMRCVGCNHSLHISRANELLRHRYDCAFADSPAPWATLAALLARQEARADDPETDGTDFAHPAYFRGKRDGIRGAVDALERVLDHGRRGGTFGDERLQAFASRLDSLRAVAQDAPPSLSRKHANEIAYFLRRPDMCHDAKRERLASLVERAGAVPQEAREPDGWAIRMRDGSWRSTVYEDRETAERKAVKAREFFAARGDEDAEFDSIDVLPVYLGAPAEATEASAPEGATWGDVRSGLRAELIAEGIPVTEATRLARKVVHRFTAAEATERSES